jgi:hypothetical protein
LCSFIRKSTGGIRPRLSSWRRLSLCSGIRTMLLKIKLSSYKVSFKLLRNSCLSSKTTACRSISFLRVRGRKGQGAGEETYLLVSWTTSSLPSPSTDRLQAVSSTSFLSIRYCMTTSSFVFAKVSNHFRNFSSNGS